jgi:hypothetical protein
MPETKAVNKSKSEKIIQGACISVITISVFFLYGLGPASTRTIGHKSSGMEVETQTLQRLKKAHQVKVQVWPKEEENKIELAINKSFLRGMATESINPKPLSTAIGKDSYIFIFEKPPGQCIVSFTLRPQELGESQLIITNGKRAKAETCIYVHP